VTLLQQLAAYERTVPETDDAAWTKMWWPHPQANASMRVQRLHRKLPNGDQFMLHRFVPGTGPACLHVHPRALAAHVLGGGLYEVGFAHRGHVHTRVLVRGEYYYEMRTHDVEHYVTILEGPIYTTAIWTEFPEERQPEALTQDLIPAADLLPTVRGAFERIWQTEALSS
jgi:hypothetical protein